MTNPFHGCQSVGELLGQYGGATSVCWESMTGTGVFQSDRARQLMEQAEARLFELLSTPVRGTDGEILTGMGTDAYAWAATFMAFSAQLQPAEDFGAMVSWFANAIEAGRMAGRRETCPHTDHITLSTDLESCRVCGELRIPPAWLGT